jgi:hypothetical protein
MGLPDRIDRISLTARANFVTGAIDVLDTLLTLHKRLFSILFTREYSPTIEGAFADFVSKRTGFASRDKIHV